MSSSKRFVASLFAFLAALSTGAALSAAAAQVPGGGLSPAEALRVRDAHGTTTFLVATPDAAASSAARDNSDLADKAGRVPAPTPGYVLTSRVVVAASDASPIAASAPGFAVEALEASPGFFVVTAPSVREALALADLLAADGRVREAYLDVDRPKNLREPTDPGYPSQWHLKNTQITIADINVVPVWNMGLLGTGITTGILEGGFQTNHTEIAANYNATASQSGGSNTTHGTSCAGLVAAVANNGKCGAGVAYAGKVSKLIYGTSSTTATAFGYRNDLNFIKSNSWGPADNGQITYLSSVERSAIDNAVATGRGNKGTIFTWAAGNGGTADRCDYDPYASNRKVVPIGAIGDQDVRSSFNETGSSMLVVAHSSGNSRAIYTITTQNRCTSSFGGTSAACPIGAGVVALMLQANPNLTWRDVQHVLVNSARKCDPGNALWTVNAAGHDINYNYGFGAIDAHAAVLMAQGWSNVPAETMVTSGVVAVNTAIPDNNPTGVTRTVNIGSNIQLETVELILNVTTTYVGDLQIRLTAPSGTQSLLAATRADPTDNYVNYVFTSRRHWDESSAGTWTVHIADQAASDLATWTNFELKLYGTP